MIYTSAHASLAVLEVLVNSAFLPTDYVLIRYQLPEDISSREQDPGSLPPDWATYPFRASTQDIGSEWIRAQESAVLKVPSAIVQTEYNWLLNPGHPEIARILAEVVGPFSFDQRLK